MIKIKGHSNYKVEFCIEKPKYLIKKSIDEQELVSEKSSQKSIQRLYKQMEKQNNFYKTQKGNILSPIIYNFKYNEPLTSYSMEYIKESITMIELIEKSSPVDIKFIYNNLIKIIDYNLSKSIVKDCKNDIISKYNSVMYDINNNNNVVICNNFKQKIEKYISSIEKECDFINIPVGLCHGDLTFSNILVDKYNYYLIDFLDNFIETPLQDIIKIRQDTKYFWTLELINFKIDTTKLIISLSNLDNMIHNYYSKFSWYNENYIKFQILNLLRIIPYVKDQHIYNTLEKHVYKLLLF